MCYSFASISILLAAFCSFLMNGCLYKDRSGCADDEWRVKLKLSNDVDAKIEYPYRMDEMSLSVLRKGLRHIKKNMAYEDLIDRLGSPTRLSVLYDSRHVIDIGGRHPPVGFSAFYIVSQRKRFGSVVERQQEAVVFRFDVEHRLIRCDIFGDISQYDINIPEELCVD